MAQYQGVITGIGDFDANINKIQPQLDASWRDWVAGGNAILSGLSNKKKQNVYTQSVTSNKVIFPTLKDIGAENIEITFDNNRTVTLKNNTGATIEVSDFEIYYATSTFIDHNVLSVPKQVSNTNTATIDIDEDAIDVVWLMYGLQVTTTKGTAQAGAVLYGTVIGTQILEMNGLADIQFGGEFTCNGKNAYNIFATKRETTAKYVTDGNKIVWTGDSQIGWQVNCTNNVISLGKRTNDTYSDEITYTTDSVTEMVLLRGSCLACGYVGTVATEIELLGEEYIYGVFIVNHDEDMPDEFYIETSDLAIDTQDDILNEAGTYYLLLYHNGELNPDLLRYPAKSYQSDTATDLVANGTIDSNAVCKTQPVDDSSQKVASTEFVWNVIQKEIAAANTSNSGTISGSDGNATYTYTIEKKANLVVLTVSISDINRLGAACNWFTVPEQYRPAENVTLAQVKNIYSTRNLILQKDGIVRQDGIVFDTITDLPTIQFGYKLN